MLRFLLRTSFRLWIAGDRRSPKPYLHLLYPESTFKTLNPSSSSVNFELIAGSLTTLAADAKNEAETPPNTKSLIDLLKSYGFTKTDIAMMATKSHVFSCHREQNIRPKLELFVAAGFTGAVIRKLVSKNPSILRFSLEKRLRPNLRLLMTILRGNREAVAASIGYCSRLLVVDPNKRLWPNIETLRKHGVNDVNIVRLFARCPRIILHEPSWFSRSADLVKKMGFEPSKAVFILGLQVLSGLTKMTWERKLKLFCSLGWSQEETNSAFKKMPLFMFCSEEKVRKIMDFFIKNLNWEPSRLALLPWVFSFSLEKRIIPRYAVFNILSMSGFASKNLSFSSFLFFSNSDFLKKFVYKYSDEVPELLEAYKVKSEMEGEVEGLKMKL